TASIFHLAFGSENRGHFCVPPPGSGQIEFAVLKPEIIIFEHILLSSEGKIRCLDLLKSEGNSISQDRWDVVAEL
ncbi:MAG: hypothetical protein P1U85_23015, partial [Verrucomicrobiales bacterium]|nr:hypothetical protein [Verrucomicrobiales bacterium]